MVNATRRRMLTGGTAAGVVSSCGFAGAFGFFARAAVAADSTGATVGSNADGAGESSSAVGAAEAADAAKATAARTCATQRIVVLDWPLTEIVLSLGAVPVGVSRPAWYTRLDGVPPLPPSAVDTGLLYQPNFEVIETLKPDLIVVTPAHAPMRTLLERIAPTFAVPLYGGGVRGGAHSDVYAAVRSATQQLAQRLCRETQAQTLIAQADAQLKRVSQRLAAFRASGRPVYLLRPIDDRHVSVFGTPSLFGGVLSRLALTNAWQGATDLQGAAEADLASLAKHPDAQAILIGVPPGVAAQLAKSPLWNALPFVARNRVAHIDANIPPLGGVVASMRFAASLGDALQGAAS
jgi:iron complex transport system substrate-binding protein